VRMQYIITDIHVYILSTASHNHPINKNKMERSKKSSKNDKKSRHIKVSRHLLCEANRS